MASKDAEKVKVHILRPWADKYGNTWKRHQEYDVSPATADMFVRKGIARLAVDVLVERVAEYGAGLYFLPGTSALLVKAAKAAKLKTYVKPKPKPPSE